MLARLPPYALAMLSSYVHECCQLCGQTIDVKPKLDIGGVADHAPFCHIPLYHAPFYHAPLLCMYCHAQWAGRLPIFAMRDDGREIALYASAYYDVPLKQVMTAFKDKGDVSSLMVLYHLMRYVKRPQGVNADNAVLIPTPTTSSRLVERGFYPVLILTRYLSFLWQIPMWQGVARLDNVIHQRGLSRSDRLHNVKHDFYLTDPLPVRHAILVDDVVTTGSTLLAMANAIWAEHPTAKIHGVCALHGREGIHLPILDG